LLFQRLAALVRSVTYRILHDSFEADDVLQEVFLQISRKCQEFDPSRGSARAWILQIAYHLAISRRRFLQSRHFYTCLDINDLDENLSSPNNTVEQIDASLDLQAQRATLLRVLDSLSLNQRRTLQLFFFEGYDFDEIAAELGQSRGNVRHHYFRGLERLRKHFFCAESQGSKSQSSAPNSRATLSIVAGQNPTVRAK
jgi:RNA polymerase sigma-70 factor, ECF subfamily